MQRSSRRPQSPLPRREPRIPRPRCVAIVDQLLRPPACRRQRTTHLLAVAPRTAAGRPVAGATAHAAKPIRCLPWGMVADCPKLRSRAQTALDERTGTRLVRRQIGADHGRRVWACGAGCSCTGVPLQHPGRVLGVNPIQLHGSRRGATASGQARRCDRGPPAARRHERIPLRGGTPRFRAQTSICLGSSGRAAPSSEHWGVVRSCRR